MRSVKVNLIFGLVGMMLPELLLLCKATGEIHYYDFVLQESNFTRLCNTKTMLTVNGSLPGPTITVHKGDTIYVNVHNQGTYGVTIHWHGVKQPRNPWSDGPENITQCPIQPGNNFTYEVIFTDEEGTLWWHAHNDWTRATVHGAIVILPPRGKTYLYPRPHHGQQTIVLGSWFNGDPKQIIEQALATGADPGASNAYTINGQPGDLYACSNETTCRVLVEYRKTYLLRLINAVMNEEQFFAIAGHKLTVVAQDASYIKPVITNYIMITPGQTMDILVTANQNPGYYYMASTPFQDARLAPFDNGTTTAILQYTGNIARPSSIPLPTLPNVTDDAAALNFTRRIRSLASYSHPIKVPLIINRHLEIAIAVNLLPCNATTGATPVRLAASLNNVSFETKPISILEAYDRNLAGVFNKDFPSDPADLFNFTGDLSNVSPYTTTGTKVKVLNYGDAVELVFQETNLLSAGGHPMHIHGYSFYIVGQGTGTFNNQTDPLSYNLVDPPLVNTFSVPKNGWVALRFFSNNPGVWFIHCHLDKHASWGMQTVLIVKNGGTALTSLRSPPANMPACS